MDEVITSVCNKLKCSQLAESLDKVNQSWNMLNKFQHFRLIDDVLKFYEKGDEKLKRASKLPGKPTIPEELGLLKISNASSDSLEFSQSDGFMEGEEEEFVCWSGFKENYEDMPEDKWLGFFKGFTVISQPDCTTVTDNRKCIEVDHSMSNSIVATYIRCGVRCFIIDLFYGTTIENLMLVVRLRGIELNVSRDLGFPVSVTIIAKLSPRLQYTGQLMKCEKSCPKKCPPTCNCFDPVMLEKGKELNLTVDRHWSTRCTKCDIYVNGRFLLVDVKPCDFLLIGEDIQLRVKEVHSDHLHCVVATGGELKSRMPVLFPPKCSKYKMSLEELEEMTFSREVGINTIVSYVPGSKEYFQDLCRTMELLKCSSMHLYSRIVLTDLDDDADDEPVDMKWVVDKYDGFLLELQQPRQVSVLHLSKTADEFMRQVYKAEKVMLLDPSDIATKKWIVHPMYYVPLFYYPDKFVFRCLKKTFHFLNLQSIIFGDVMESQLGKLPVCDSSASGIDSLARSCVITSYEVHAKAIFVCSYHSCVIRKLAHYRPSVPIIFITAMESLTKSISLHHNVIMLYFRSIKEEDFKKRIYKYLLFGIVYARSMELIKQDDNVLLVFSQDPQVEYTDKFLIYKYCERNFVQHLNQMLFK